MRMRCSVVFFSTIKNAYMVLCCFPDRLHNLILLFRDLAFSLVLAGLLDRFVISAICNFKPSTSLLILDISDTLAVKLQLHQLTSDLVLDSQMVCLLEHEKP